MHTVIEPKDPRFSRFWSELYANDPQQNPFYDTPVKSGTARSPGFGSRRQAQYEDRSFVVVLGEVPVFGCSLTLHTDQGGRRCLGYFGMEASTHVNPRTMAGGSNNFRPEAVLLLQNHMDRLFNELQPNRVDYLDPVSCGIMSPLTQVLLEKGATPRIQRVQAIALDRSERLLRRALSPRHRALVGWASRNLGIEVGSTPAHGITPDIGSAAAGRAHCEELLKRKRAFYVQGFRRGRVLAECFFAHNSRTCQFVFAGRDRELADRPALYGLLWHGMLHGRRLGCSHFNLTNTTAPEPDCNAVELLAEGFGGTSTTRLKVSLAR